MNLTPAEQAMLDGTTDRPGRAIVQRMMRLLVRLGRIYGAERMVDISSAQISGVSYKSIGEPGLEFLEDLAANGVKAVAHATLNPAGIDLENWRELGFPADFAARQERILSAFGAIGVVTSATCTPYLIGNQPGRGQHVAWAESSAVSFANSVLGARSNREGGPSALAAAICGCTPYYGLHLEGNRRPTVRVAVEGELTSRADFGSLGYAVGKRVKDGIPYFTGIARASKDELKSLGAAMAASGAVALYHIEGITPEAEAYAGLSLDGFSITVRELRATRSLLTTGRQADLVVFGCPHASFDEITEIAKKLEGRTVRRPLWVCTSRVIKKQAEDSGAAARIEQAGGRLVADTCMVVSPIEKMGYSTVAVDSGKAAAYLPGFCQQQVMFKDLDELVEEACR